MPARSYTTRTPFALWNGLPQALGLDALHHAHVVLMLAFGGRQVAQAVVVHVQTEDVPDGHLLRLMPLVMGAGLVLMHIHGEACVFVCSDN